MRHIATAGQTALDGHPNSAKSALTQKTERAANELARPVAESIQAFLGHALALSAIMLVVKGMLLPFEVDGPVGLIRWVLRLLIVCSADIGFVMVLTLLAVASVWLTRRRPRLNRAAIWAATAAFYAAGIYAVISLPLFRITLVPFSVRFLAFAGGPSVMLSSATPFVTPSTLVLLCLAPLLAHAAARICCRASGGAFRPMLRPGLVAGGAVCLVAYCAVCQAYIGRNWSDPGRWERRIAQNPHSVFLSSCAMELLREEPFSYSFNFAEIDDSDFVSPANAAATTGAGASPASPASTADAAAELPWPPGERPKNILLVVMESVGAEYLGLYGAPYHNTPNLERLAAEQGLVFDNFYVQAPNSCKSLFSLTTSVSDRADNRFIIRDRPEIQVPLISDVLRERGYRSCYLHSGLWSWRYRDKFFGRAGDKLIDAETLPPDWVNSWGVADETMFTAALDWAQQKPDEPFFVLAFTIETHHPYAVPKETTDFQVTDPDLNRYLNAIQGADAHLAWLQQELVRRGLAESTLLVITADHGESFGQHQQRVHGFGVYQPNVRVPLVMLHPGLKGKSGRVRQVRTQVDLPRTLIDLAGATAPAAWQGKNLFRPQEDRAYFFATGHEAVLGLRDGPYKYHYYVDTDREELFDLSADPGEERNLAKSDPARCAEYHKRVGGFATVRRKQLRELGVYH